MKYLFLALLGVSSIQITFTQNSTVSLKTTGSGETKEKAIQYSLRSAIEQAFGAFISSNTEILNEELVADEISSVASGNIEKYDILTELENKDKTSWYVTTNVVVSVSKLTEFVKSKGVEVEEQGGLFAVNIKQKKLNSDGEYKALLAMLKPYHEAMSNAYNYELEVGEPVAKDQEDKLWNIDLVVTANANKNLYNASEILKNTLSSLTLTPEEIAEYTKLNKQIFPVMIDYAGAAEIIRNEWEQQTNALLQKKEKEKKFAKEQLISKLSSEQYPAGKYLTEISEDIQISLEETINTLVKINPYLVKGKSEKSKLRVNIGKNYFEDAFMRKLRTELDGNPIIQLENIDYQTIYFLRNRKSLELLRNVVSLHLASYYPRNFNITSNVNSYFSNPKTNIGLDKKLIILDELSIDERKKERDKNGYGRFVSQSFNTNSQISTLSGQKLEISKYHFRPHRNLKTDKWTNSLVSLTFQPKKQFAFSDELSLSEVEKLNGYKVSVNENVFSIANGGLTFKNGLKRIVIPIAPKLPDLEGDKDSCFEKATNICKNLDVGGFSDWELPSAQDAFFLFESYHPYMQYHFIKESASSRDFSYNIRGTYGHFIGLRMISKTNPLKVAYEDNNGKRESYRFTQIHRDGFFVGANTYGLPKECFCVRVLD